MITIADRQIARPDSSSEGHRGSPLAGRRSISGLLGGAGLALLAGAAALWPDAVRADCLGSPCCSLASCTQCSYSGLKCNYSCPGGYSPHLWYCYYGSSLVACGECNTGSDCWGGSFACSIWWWVGSLC